MNEEDEETLAAFLADRQGLTDEDLAGLLARCRDDPDHARRCKALLLIDEGLSRLLDQDRQHFPARVRQALVEQEGPGTFTERVIAALETRRRRVRRRGWAMAGGSAGVLLGVVLLLVFARSGVFPGMVGGDGLPIRLVAGEARISGSAGERPLQDSDRIGAGERLCVTAGRASILLAGGRIDCGPGVLRLGDDPDAPGWILHLERGRVEADLPEPLPCPLQVLTDDCAVTVTGTVFTVTATESGSRVTVASGTVDISDLHRRRRLRLSAGASMQVAGGGESMLVEDLVLGGTRPPGPLYLPGASDPVRASVVWDRRRDGRPCWEVDLQGDGAWFAVGLRPPVDGVGTDGLLLRFYGSGDGGALGIEVADRSGPVPEHFMAVLVDDLAGWRSIAVPWSAFTRRDWQPHALAPDDGFARHRLGLIGIIRIGGGRSRLAIEGIGLCRPP